MFEREIEKQQIKNKKSYEDQAYRDGVRNAIIQE